jgi:hypothetical protein
MTKKLATKPKKLQRKRKTPRTKRFSLAQDEAARQKISKTLDIEAFDAYYKKHAADMIKYWETKE